MQEDKKGIDGLEKCLELAAKNIALGIEIGKDGVNWDDLKHAPQAFENIKELVEFIHSKPELIEEIKDIDAAEGFLLIQKAYSAYQQIKAK